ncbi:hypothetical protein HQ576_13905, partial [bacterium]|nr:hypothetical protein [bacterium]
MSTFEILADRLAHAATVAERMAAAEQLAALADPRVAPALARALADADDGVRARADELLAQFCHRDQDSSLRLLLDEAERMADALSTEV